ncbi:MAG: potassium/proton antiporter [candidate division KSB1 bacterium]|nr:potassium/proton antiporter [candidate division KSB1 bacterium]MDZ7274195.1 potassium/proton antiporter [candidate division KSB1 bacterium]MDZ7287283.1 potassium/proton antiporter [candidate division KSB1 bacterium]MDZ7296793.1 potassium/proton antiporter [candidate division KSB1 bacterium]MDZ7347659.1 potassium/proton antiporter [candidate division KSB1 bacterium]
MTLAYLLLIGSVLILFSLGMAKLSANLGVPVLLLFLAIGMLAGSEGPGGIYFDDAGMAQSVGIIALVFILFAGGLDTDWKAVRPVLWPAAGLATVGVLLTALIVGVVAHLFYSFSLLEGLLLGAVISSTDAAAVFAVLRARNVSLRGDLKPLLELESGSNDPMAVFLTVGLIQMLTAPATSLPQLAWLFVLQMSLGAACGVGLGKLLTVLLNRVNFVQEGFYPVLVLAYALLIYGATALLGGSAFLAVYLAGMVAGNSEFVHKKSLLRFFDGLAWLSQIGMFLTLGLLVFPSRIVPVMGAGLLLSAVLMLAARPLSVFLTLAFSRFNWREKALISWVGLRGAVPVILATFPLLARLPNAELLFNLVFFIVFTSALLQGWSMPAVARLLKVDAPVARRRQYPIEFAPPTGMDTDLVEFVVPAHAAVAGKSLVEIGMPRDSLIVLISQNEEFIVPSGGTVINEGDVVLALVNKRNLPEVRAIFSRVA